MKKILIIGFCIPDSEKLRLELTSLFKARVVQFERLDDLNEYLQEKDADLIIINRVIDSDKSSGIKILDYLRLKSPRIPIAITTGIVKHQKEAIGRGAFLSFDLDLIIGFLGKKRQVQKDEVVLKINEILRSVD